MLTLPEELIRRYEALLKQQAIAGHHRPHYLKWLRYYREFCHRYALEPANRNSFPAFETKLRVKNQSDFQRQQARQAISLYYGVISTSRGHARQPLGEVHGNGSGDRRSKVTPAVRRPTEAAAATGVRPSMIGQNSPRQHEAGAPSRPSGRAGNPLRWMQPKDPIERRLTKAN